MEKESGLGLAAVQRSELEPHLQLWEVPDRWTLTGQTLYSHALVRTYGRTHLRASLLKLLTETLCVAAAAAARTLALKS